MENRRIDRNLFYRAKRIVNREPCLSHIKDAGITFTVLRSDRERITKRKLVYGECEKVPDKYRWKVKYDFLITVYDPNIIDFTDEQIDILLFHELKHIGADLSRDEPTLYVVPHDIEEFYEIIERFGMDWQVM